MQRHGSNPFDYDAAAYKEAAVFNNRPSRRALEMRPSAGAWPEKGDAPLPCSIQRDGRVRERGNDGHALVILLLRPRKHPSDLPPSVADESFCERRSYKAADGLAI
jgi:hypothetical protein